MFTLSVLTVIGLSTSVIGVTSYLYSHPFWYDSGIFQYKTQKPIVDSALDKTVSAENIAPPIMRDENIVNSDTQIESVESPVIESPVVQTQIVENINENQLVDTQIVSVDNILNTSEHIATMTLQRENGSPIIIDRINSNIGIQTLEPTMVKPEVVPTNVIDLNIWSQFVNWLTEIFSLSSSDVDGLNMNRVNDWRNQIDQTAPSSNSTIKTITNSIEVTPSDSCSNVEAIASESEASVSISEFIIRSEPEDGVEYVYDTNIDGTEYFFAIIEAPKNVTDIPEIITEIINNIQ